MSSSPSLEKRVEDVQEQAVPVDSSLAPEAAEAAATEGAQAEVQPAEAVVEAPSAEVSVDKASSAEGVAAQAEVDKAPSVEAAAAEAAAGGVPSAESEAAEVSSKSPSAEPEAGEALSSEALAAEAAAAAKAKRRAKRRKRRKRRKKRAAMLAAAKELHKTSVSDEVVIRFDHVTKTFKLYKNDRARFLGFFNINRRGKLLGTVNANDDLSFEIKRGEALAFLGPNGAGKSTALKMISGVMYPTSGTVEVNGRVSALLELKAGFDSKLTGRENIHLRGQILGFTRQEIDELMPDVEEFADLGLYFDQPMKSYSSGMRSRLGFAFAVATNPEILIVDEALSVGDKAFKRKCLKRIREIMMDENVTVLFVTHSSTTAQQFCSRGIVLDQGKKVFEGTIEDATAYYEVYY